MISYLVSVGPEFNLTWARILSGPQVVLGGSPNLLSVGYTYLSLAANVCSVWLQIYSQWPQFFSQWAPEVFSDLFVLVHACYRIQEHRMICIHFFRGGFVGRACMKLTECNAFSKHTRFLGIHHLVCFTWIQLLRRSIV